MAFKTNVFINCPFDKRYKRLLQPIIFTCIYCKLEPQISKLEDSGSTRVRNIIKLIKASKFGIHDLSRMKSKKANELARFNMPFELGLDLGLRESGQLRWTTKVCLVIDTERYRYQAALSDLGGSDIMSYGKKNQVENLIKSIRTWFTHVAGPTQPPSSKLYLEYTEFVADLQLKLESLKFSLDDIQNLTNVEFIHYAKEWVIGRNT